MGFKCKPNLATAFAAVMLSLPGIALAQNVQVAHAAPFADSAEDTAVTVLVNGNVILQNFQFGEVASLSAGGAPEIQVEVVPAGANDPVISDTVALGEDVTILAVGDGVRQDLGLLRLSDVVEAPDSGLVNLRVVHGASFADDVEDTEVAVRTAGGAELAEPLNSLRFREDSGFLPVGAGVVDVKVTSPDGSTNLIDPLPVELLEGANVTVVAIGNGDQQPLGALALPGIGQLETRAPVDNSVNGWWGPTATDKEGLIAQPIPAENRLVGTIYTYDPEGSGTPRWFTFDSCGQQETGPGCPTPGNFDGIATTASVFEFDGGQFGDGSDATGELAGELTIEFADCDSAVAALELSSGSVLTWNLRKLVDVVPCTLDSRQVSIDLSANANDGLLPGGVEGTATFREWPGNRTLVELALADGSTGTNVAHSAHIHFNSVDEGGDIAIFLGPIDGLGPAEGASQFIVDESFDTLLAFDGHINIHESNANLGNIVANGNIGANAGAEVQANGLNPLPSGRRQIYDLPANANEGALPSGVDAEAEFIEIDGTHTLVALRLTDGSTETTISHPAHIHFNSVDEGGDIAIFLGPIDGLGPAPGVSYAVVERSFDELVAFDGHINIHQSNAALGNIVARGNIGSNAD